MATGQPRGPFRLVTVNNAPERAKLVIGQVSDALKDRYIIDHAGNCDDPSQVESKVEQLQPDLLFCASMWTVEQSTSIIEAGKRVKPNIITYAIPYGLQVAGGPNAIVEHLKEQIPKLLG